MIRSIRHVAAIALIGLLGAACGSDDDPAGEAVRSFTDVQDSELAFEIDPNGPGRAIFRVDTTLPMICSITWGESDALGNQNNSLTMDGTGIEEHDVILPGAEPGTEYFFTVQGADAEGTLYKSELLSVTIPETGSAVFPVGETAFDVSDAGGPAASEETVDPRSEGENLALDAIITDVSSEFGPSFGAERAIDGDLDTDWSSQGDDDDAFIELDLGEPREIAGVEFLTRSMADDSAITATFTVTVDGETFGPFDAGTLRASRFAPLDGVTGQIVRFDVEESSGGNTGAIEVRVLAPTA
jgi:hypothetical protein